MLKETAIIETTTATKGAILTAETAQVHQATTTTTEVVIDHQYQHTAAAAAGTMIEEETIRTTDHRQATIAGANAKPSIRNTFLFYISK